jgi:serine/threonine protein kinase
MSPRKSCSVNVMVWMFSFLFTKSDKCSSIGFTIYISVSSLDIGRTVDMWSLGVITYILLGGYPPFADKDTKNMYRKICTAQFQFHKKYWNQVSDLAKDFISKLLVVEPTERLTAEQALEHPWFSSNESFMSVENLTDNLEKLRVFNLKRKVRAAVYAVIATNKLTSLGFFSHSMEIDIKP